LFLVVEEEGKIEGFGGARAKSDDVLAIERFLVSEFESRQEAEKEMLRVIVAFAPRMLYERIECDTTVDVSLLAEYDFSSDKPPHLSIEPDF
ncbi:MAG TPA: hypothetical protein PKD05_24285, partial [Candidatus Melainabacteria bacterium]|nr:hypothetical protein [Candidatus Melainabacteria bacterium]